MDEELRIAVVMNGGVSLAVWIGGVTLELGRLLACESAYGEIQALTGTKTRVDVICGTSAGGINGAFLALAMAHHPKDLGQALGLLRSLWVNKGSIGELLRDPFASDSRSLLDGDGYFLEELRQAFRTLQTAPISSPQDVPIDLVMTTTLLRGLEREHADDFGSRIRDVTHRGAFTFSRGPGMDRDAFSHPDIAHQLALAARSTASFPGAFEPSFCPVRDSTDQPFRPDMKDVASFASSRFVLDGGILDNSPIDLALDSIYHQRAGGPVRRVLAYVVPDPGTTARKQGDGADKPDKPDELPELLDVGVASLVQIPAVQSISSQLQQLRDHNEEVRSRRRARVLLTKHTPPNEIDGMAGTLFSAYRAQRIADAIDYILLEISKGLVLAGHRGLGRRGRREWLCRTMTNLIPSSPWIPATPPHTPAGEAERSVDGWRWGTRPVEHIAKLYLDIVIRLQSVSTLLSSHQSLREEWDAAYDILADTEQIRAADRGYWRREAERIAFVGDEQLVQKAQASQWIEQAVARWQAGAYQRAGRLVHEIAGRILALREAVVALASAAANSNDPFARDQADDLRSLFDYFVRSRSDTATDVVSRLLAFEVVQDALGGRGTGAEQEVGFVEISARSRSNFGGPEEPAQKIAGIQLAHFGGFYKSSWRANDWMWGRVDAVHRLVRILLDPGRLRIASRRFPIGTRAINVSKEIMRIAVGTADRTLRAELEQVTPSPLDLEAELAYLDDDSFLAPESLPLSVAALSRRLEGEILIVELPRLADTVASDCDAGFYGSDNAKSFAARCRALADHGVLRADQLRDILSTCDIGKERLEREVGTDRLSAVATQAVAVGVSAMRSEHKLLSKASKLLAALRTPALLFYIFSRNAWYRSRTGVAVNAAALAGGGAIVATEVFAKDNPYNNWLLALGIISVAGPGILAALRWPGLGRKIAVALAVVILALILAVVFHLVALPGLTVETWQNIAVASVALLMLILVQSL